MDELHSLDPRRQELLEARFMGGVGGSTGGSTGSASGGTKVSSSVSFASWEKLLVGEGYCDCWSSEGLNGKVTIRKRDPTTLSVPSLTHTGLVTK